jgi:UrcA family protein
LSPFSETIQLTHQELNMVTSMTKARQVRLSIMIAACVGLPVLGADAMAQDPSTAAGAMETMKVSLAGLDLTTPVGVRAAQERVRMAARRICAKAAISADISTSLRYITCLDEAMAGPVSQIDEMARQSAAQRWAQNRSGE